MGTFAENTSVPVERSRAELERTLQRYGATAFGYLSEAERSVIMFEAKGRRIRFELPLPRRDAKQFQFHSRGARTPAAALEAWEQACRQRWRALNLAVKAKLEAVEAGIAEFEEEFLAYICLPNGSTVGEHTRAAIAEAYETNSMPALTMGGAR